MKKRGLIVSTIVMVVVLAVAITTATYAWFNSQAKATIANINVQTVATTGLEVATYDQATGTGYANGQVTWDGSKFTGQDGFGSLVDFSSVSTILGSLDTAVTPKGVLTLHKLVAVNDEDDFATYWVVDAVAKAMVKADANGGVYNDTAKYYIIDTATPTYVKPIAYTSDIKPIGYQAASSNKDYMTLPIAVRATDVMDYIFCTLTLSPKQGEMSSADYMPGMAAATFIKISDGTNEVALEPYSTILTGDSGLTVSTDADYVYKFVVAKGNIAALDVFKLTYTIYIEGTDGQCIQITAGSGFDINIDYSFMEDGSTATEIPASVTVGADVYLITTLTATKA